ncbi:MAG: response regulator [Steroidobacteraceae bacterium]|nr:response regulator [Deltaproteobacteria bacterium]
MRSLSLRIKFIIGTVLLILLVGGALGLLVNHELHNRFEEEIHKRGLSTARYIAEAAEIPLITENKVSLQLLVNDYRKIDQDIGYIFIVDPHDELLVHTFGSNIPTQLVRKAIEKTPLAEHFVLIDTSEDPTYDISVTIQKGALGTVHIGVYESVVRNNVQGVLMRMFPFVLFILALGVMAAIAFAAAITRPVALLTKSVQRFSAGELNEPIIIAARDEIGQLATAFNAMTEKLRSTTVSREYMEKLIDSMNDVLIVISPEGVVQSVNRAYSELFGYQPSAVIGRRVEEFNEEGAPLCIYSAFTSTLECGPVHGIECSCHTASGESIPMLFSMAVMKDESDRPQAVICAAQNIKSLKKVQDELRQKQTEMEEINRNLEQIVASRTAELAIGNEGLRAEVAERQKTTEELRAARDAAESANRAKSEFLANMSHEMRTPLNSIIGGTDYLDSDAFTPDQQRCLTMIRQAGDSLLELINDLIDLSRIEAGQLVIVKRPFNLPDTLERVILMLGRDAERKHIQLTLKTAPEVPHFLGGDQMRLQQVLVNLISNAIKFTDPDGIVSVAVSSSDGQGELTPVTFVVRDNGIGIDPLKFNMIFESFAQADASITRRYGGSGLGLAISRKLVEAMGGTLQVESLPGAGSSFTFRIGFTQHEKPAERLLKPPETESADMTPQDQTLQTGATKRVLLVDDASENRELIRLLLLKLPLTLDEAVNGQEAFTLFEMNSYDLIFMDIQMPVMDGYTATRMIRRLEEQTGRKRTAIVALTAHAYEADILACLEAGCDDHIAKPFKKKTLMQCLSTHIRGVSYE